MSTRPWTPAATAWARLPRDARDTLFLVAVSAWTIGPHLAYRPAWFGLGVIALLAWRVHLTLARRPLPGRWAVVALLVLSAGATAWHEGTLLGREAGVSMLVVLMALKTLELRARRDAVVLFFLGFFVVLTHFFDAQGPGTALAMAVAVWGLLTALVLAHMPVGRPPLRHAALVALRAAALGTPVMVALFLFFPRLDPLWALPERPSARTGLSGALQMGSIADLAVDESIALRLRFDGPAPPPSALYFRGPVLSWFDGRTWTRDRTSAGGLPAWTPSLPADLEGAGTARGYEMTVEPSRLPLLPLLEGTAPPLELTPRDALQTVELRSDLQWQVSPPVASVVQVRAQAWDQWRHGTRAGAYALRDLVDLPAGFNPRTMAWAAELRRQPGMDTADSRTMANAVLANVRSAGFNYTFSPGTYGRDAVDEFWLDRRAGFCEHFASAFVVVMRALDVPARIVTGYQGADPAPVDGWWVVRQRHAHAWAEIWQPGEGWLRVDPTAAVAPDRIERSRNLVPPRGLVGQAIANVNPEWLRTLRQTWERLDQRWNQWVLGYSRAQQFNLLERLGAQTPSLLDLARALLGLLVAAALAGLAWAAWHRRRLTPWQRTQTAVARQLQGLGLHCPPHEGPRAWAQRVQQALGPPAEPLAQALLELERLRYGRGAQSGAAVPAAWRRTFLHAWRQARQHRRAAPDGPRPVDTQGTAT
jgi:transglutaminase-like putative cysteine protease